MTEDNETSIRACFEAAFRTLTPEQIRELVMEPYRSINLEVTR